MDVLGWTVVGAVAAVVGAVAAVTGPLPGLLSRSRRTGGRPDLRVRVSRSAGNVLPAPQLAVQARGRADVIDALSGLARVPDGHVHVLAGAGGLGKSTVARAVAEQVKAGGGRVWWVPAGDSVLLAQLLLGLARELGASTGQVKEALAGRLNPSDVLWSQLEQSPGWTLLLDNADDLATLAVGGRGVDSGSGWLRSSQAGLMVVTSRMGDQTVWGPVVAMHRLGPLGDKEGALVLMDLAPRAGDEHAAQRLSARLGGLPLALHHAGSYLASPLRCRDDVRRV